MECDWAWLCTRHSFPGNAALCWQTYTDKHHSGVATRREQRATGDGASRQFTGVCFNAKSSRTYQSNGLRILGSLIQSINSLNNNGSPERNDPNTTVSPLHSLFAQLFNPANAAHGDAVYTEEALDRVISQIMEQANGASAPGPASAEAISRLPQKAADKSMMGSDGKAECSVCMDSVSLGDTVTVLPCRHWFHGECVGAWLREHDTCPHCRQGIMPKDPGDASDPAARPPGLPPRNSQPPSPAATPSGTGPGRAVQFTWQSGGPGTFPTVDPRSRPHDYTRHQPGSREGRNGGEGSSGGGSSGGGGGGLSGWVRDRWGRGNSDRT